MDVRFQRLRASSRHDQYCDHDADRGLFAVVVSRSPDLAMRRSAARQCNEGLDYDGRAAATYGCGVTQGRPSDETVISFACGPTLQRDLFFAHRVRASGPGNLYGECYLR